MLHITLKTIEFVRTIRPRQMKNYLFKNGCFHYLYNERVLDHILVLSLVTITQNTSLLYAKSKMVCNDLLKTELFKVSCFIYIIYLSFNYTDNKKTI